MSKVYKVILEERVETTYDIEAESEEGARERLFLFHELEPSEGSKIELGWLDTEVKDTIVEEIRERAKNANME